MGALQWINDPGYHALILRRTFQQFNKPESIMFAADEWLGSTEARWNQQDHQWKFPSGATLTFGHMETLKAVENYQGSAYSYVGYDELGQFKEQMYTYLFSRMSRTTGRTRPLRMRATGNPGGEGHTFCYRRFIDPKTRGNRAFIDALLTDNYHVDAADYIEGMQEMDPIRRAQLLHGDWRTFKGGRFTDDMLKNRWTQELDRYHLGPLRIPVGECWRFMTVDPAASSLQTAKTDDPDYTVISVWAVTPDVPTKLLWLDCARFRKETPDIVPEIEALYALWLPDFVGIEAVAANQAVLQLAQRTNMVVRALRTRGQDKLVRATPAMALARAGRLWLPDGAHWLQEALPELLAFTGKDDGHNDQVDTLGYAASLLNEAGSDGLIGMPMILSRRAKW